jgi:erythromycin esterase
MLLPALLATVITQSPSTDSTAQVAWLRDQAVVVRTIDEPKPDEREDFSDLQPLKALIGSARVVGLGEQSHGDGSTFKAKCRLVRFLHQEMGFDVLAWESGLFDCRRVDELFAKGVEPDKAAATAWENGVFGIWAQSAQARPMLEYAARTQTTDRRLIIAGFDCQFTSTASRRAFAPWVKTWFENCKTDLPQETVDAGTAAVEWLASRLRDTGGKPTGDQDKLAESREAAEALIRLVETRRADLETRTPAHEVEFLRRTLLNLLGYDRSRREFDMSAPRDNPPEIAWLRDRLMGENLAFLATDYFKGKKIIAWAASSHLLRNPAECESLYGGIGKDHRDASTPMGHIAAKLLGADYFTITFSASGGRIGRPWSGPSPIEPAEPGDLEALMADAGLNLAIIPLNPAKTDASAAWLLQPQVMRPMGYGRERSVWGRCFDLLFFTKTMEPSTR